MAIIIPKSPQIVDADGNLTREWQRVFDAMKLEIEKLQKRVKALEGDQNSGQQ